MEEEEVKEVKFYEKRYDSKYTMNPVVTAAEEILLYNKVYTLSLRKELL